MCVSCTLVSRVFFPCHDAIPSSRVFFRAITHGSSSTSLLLVQHDRMHSTLSVVVPTIATYAYSRIVSLVEETVNWRVIADCYGTVVVSPRMWWWWSTSWCISSKTPVASIRQMGVYCVSTVGTALTRKRKQMMDKTVNTWHCIA